jgi:predicted MFS family arabinose efflux permease
MALVFAAVSFGVGGLIPNLVPLLTDRGLSAAEAAGYAALLGVTVILGRVTAGFLVDRFWAPAVGIAFLSVPALACVALTGSTLPSGVATGLAAALVGLAAGAEFDLVAYLCARYFGMRRYGLLYALQSVFLMVAAGVAPLVFARTFDATGSYDAALWTAAALFAVTPWFLLTLGRYPRHD